jgi:hypothetical protein
MYAKFLLIILFLVNLAKSKELGTPSIQAPLIVGEELEVKEKRIYPMEPPVSKEEVTPGMLSASAVTLFTDLAETLKTLPGVITEGDFSGLLYIRGCYPFETIFLLDNVFIYWPYRWGGMLTFFNPELIKRVDFYAGGYPARGNQALGGIIDVEYKTGNKEKRQGYLNISPTTSEFRLEGPFIKGKKASYLLSTSRTYYDLVLNWFTKEKNLTYPYFYDLCGKFYFSPSYRNKLYLTLLRVGEGMKMKKSKEEEASPLFEEATEEYDFDYNYTKDIFAINYQHIFSKDLTSNLTLSYLLDKGDFKFCVEDTGFKQTLRMLNYGIRPEFSYYIGENNILNFGGMFYRGRGDVKGEYKFSQVEPNGELLKKKPYREEYSWHRTTEYLGIYLWDKYKIHPQITIEPQIRYEYNNLSKESLISPRFAVSLAFRSGKLKFAWGDYSQYPFVGGHISPDENTFRRLKAAHSLQHILGYETDIGKNKRLKIELYNNNLKRLILPDKEQDLLNKGKGYSRGIEIFLQKKEEESARNNWDGWISYSYNKSRREIGIDEYEANRGTSKQENELYPTEQDRPHVLSFVLNYKFPVWKLKANLKATYASGQPYTPLKEVKSYRSGTETLYLPIWGEYMSKRLPPYFKVDLTIKRDFKFGKFIKGEWYCQFLNLFNYKNIYDYYYSEDYREKKEVKGLPFMFIGGVKFYF